MKLMKLYSFVETPYGAEMVFSNGTRKQIVLSELTEEVRHRALLHGLKQKIIDAAAIPRDPDTGRSAPTEEKIGAMLAVIDRLQAGQWNATGATGGARVDVLLARAIAEVTGKPVEQLIEALAKKTRAERIALENNPKIKPILEELRENMVGGIDSDALLESFTEE